MIPRRILLCTAFLAVGLSLAAPAWADGARDLATSGYYVVLFSEPSLARYSGGIAGLEATNPAARGERKLDAKSPASRAYLDYLSHRQRLHLDAIESTLGRPVPVLFSYRAAGNGVAVALSPSEAARVAALPGVKSVLPDVQVPLDTDRGPTWIGAPGIWDGTQTGGLGATKGEGMVLGDIDTGVNMNHPSFSDSPPDGYVYVNPLGTGVFGGWCDPGNPNFDPSYACNDKLFAAWDFTDAFCTANPGTCSEADGPEDDNGHGSHTASTAVGNMLNSPAISGVAHRASLITYDACYTNSAGQGLCPFVATSAATNQAIMDGVDAINYSIGGGSAPWSGDSDTFFLDAVAAGIFVSASAGNSGPGASTVAHLGPWVMTVGASTHDRVNVFNDLESMSGGVSPPADMQGASRTTGVGPLPIVHARAFDAFPPGDPLDGQCSAAFAGGTFTGMIVMCDRGQNLARVLKCANVAAGGAAGCILGNLTETGIVADPHVIPATHVDQAEGNALRTWLASGSGHMGTITGSAIVTDPAVADIMASFSSRGPNASFNVIKPDVTNPGASIFAAVHENSVVGASPDFGTLSGTSMSSPHTAGSGLLIQALHPMWTPSEVKSALMTTADLTVLKENGVTPADAHDMGAGRVDLSRAGRAGLILDETEANYLAANPGIGGNPRTLNIPSFNHSACAGLCSFTRTVENATASSLTWTASKTGPPGLAIRATPSSFTLAAGATQVITVDVSVSYLLPLGVYQFGQLVLTPNDANVPETHMPVAIIGTAINALFADGFESGNTSAWSVVVP
ncbi:MAG TPA: S8 family serine peptidase [Thermoanaerobaculia bacterium]|nr:S8 family serine peptidase [Thermoanaerobaculia bacterium]